MEGFGDLKELLKKRDEGQLPDPSLTDRFNDQVKMQSSPVQPGDETIYNNTPRNSVVGGLGLPNTWMESQKDQKEYVQNLPENLGTAMGSVGNTVAQEAKAVAQAHPFPGLVGYLEQNFPMMNKDLQSKIHGSSVMQDMMAKYKSGEMPLYEFLRKYQRAQQKVENALSAKNLNPTNP